MWQHGDKCKVNLPKKIRHLYPTVHGQVCTIEFINPNTGYVHVTTPDGGTATLLPQYLNTTRE